MIALRLCPWCNGVPVWIGQDKFGHRVPWCDAVPRSKRALACVTPQCGLQPATRWRGPSQQAVADDLADVAMWNNRLDREPRQAPKSALQELIAQIHRNLGRIEDLRDQEVQYPPENPPCE